MEKKTLSNILEGKIFQIPDYQRGYAWEAKQWKDFVELANRKEELKGRRGCLRGMPGWFGYSYRLCFTVIRFG